MKLPVRGFGEVRGSSALKQSRSDSGAWHIAAFSLPAPDLMKIDIEGWGKPKRCGARGT